MTDADRDVGIDWSHLLGQIDEDPLPPIALAETLSDVYPVDMKTAHDQVHTAIDDGTLSHSGDGFGHVELEDQTGDVEISTDANGYIEDPEFGDDLDAVREHYHSVESVIENMSLLGDQYPTLGFAGNAGWYMTRDSGVISQIEAGYTKRARCTTFDRDFEHIVNSQLEAAGRGREVFNVSSWKDPTAANAWKHCTSTTDDDEREWSGDGHPPEYADLRGFGFWVDLDLKHKDGRAALTDAEVETVERTQQRVIEAVADAHNVDASDVYALDSGGGAYVYGPPEATLPVIEYLDPQEAEWFLDDLADRINDGPLEQTVVEIIEAEDADELLDPDWIHNKNRQTKAPGAIHNSHDVVVTPLRDRHPDTGDPVTDAQYRPTLITQFADSDIASLEAWADGLTTIEHTDAVGPLLRTLYPEHIANTDGWRDIVDAVVDRCRREHDRIQERRQERAEAIEQLVEDEADGAIDRPDIDADAVGSLRSPSGLVSGTEIVTSRSELSAAVDTIDVRDVIQNHASDRYDTSSRSHEVTFDPSWRTSGSGKSCAIPSGQNNFIDNGCNAGGGPVFAYALGESIIRAGEKAPTRSLTAEEFGEALDAMRSDGYNIPVYVPAADDEYDQTPLWGLRKAALALGVIDSRDEFKEHETDDGETYLGFDAATYNSVLDALDDEDIDHGRTRVDTMTDRPTAGELGLGGVEEDPEQAAQNVLALLELTKTN